MIINKKRIPTFGYQVVLLDYGLVMHKDWIKNKKELKEFNELMMEEFHWTLHNLLQRKRNFYHILEEKGVPFVPRKKILHMIQKLRPLIYQHWYNILRPHNKSDLNDIILLYHVHDPVDFQKFFLETFTKPSDKINLKMFGIKITYH